MGKFDNMGKDALIRLEEIVNASKVSGLLNKKDDDKRKKTLLLMLAAIGAVAAAAGIAYAVYKFFTPDYLEDFEDDFEDDFDDEYFDDNDVEN